MSYINIPKEKLLSILVSRMAIFFFLMCLVTLFLYGIGIKHGFTDSTQLAILRLYVVLGIFLAVSSLCGAILNTERLLKLKMMRYFLRAGFYTFLVVFSVVTTVSIMFIVTLSSGNGV